jgi:DNA-binding transcriptional LysR family regulator
MGRWGPGGAISIELDPKVKVGNSLVLRDLLIAGQGIGTLPDFVSNEAEARGELVRVLPGLGAAGAGDLRRNGFTARHGRTGDRLSSSICAPLSS